MGWRGALPESRLGRPVAADRVAAWHALFAARFLTKPGWIGDWLQVFSKVAIHTSPPGFILLYPERPCFTTMSGAF